MKRCYNCFLNTLRTLLFTDLWWFFKKEGKKEKKDRKKDYIVIESDVSTLDTESYDQSVFVTSCTVTV